jgi:Tol biopolymer transport system component
VLDDVDSPISFSPDGREFVFHRGADPESHLVVADVGGRTQRILAVQKVPARFSPYAPDWSPDGTVVAAGVTDMRSTSQTIVLLPVGGGASRQLFTSEGLIGRLRWLPDGSGLLAVISEGRARRQYAGLRGGALWRIDYPGGRAERMTSDLDGPHPCCLDIDANGRVVATVVNKVVSDLWIAPADRLDAPRQVTWDRPVVGRHSWLPDNDTLVYRDLGGRLNVVHKNGRASRLPVPDGQEVGGGVSACGDGRRVVFAALPGMNLWRVGLAPDAGGLHKLTAGLNDFNPACSRDGQWVFFASREPDHVSLWRVSIEGGTPTPLGPVSAYDVLPSPGGGMIYYATDELRESDRSTTRAGTRIRQDRWVVISSSDQARLAELDVPRDITFGTLPNWTPDESGLDYVVTRNGMSNIWRQPLAGGPPLQITNLSLGRIFSFAWSPDGRWLSIGAGAQRADVVLMSSEP